MQEKERKLIIDHLKEKGYEETLINTYFDKLEKYVMDQARKLIKGNSGMVEDSTVFNWCEDYFNDEEYLKTPGAAKPKENEEKEEAKPEEKKELEPIWQRPKPVKSKEADGQISLW